MTYWTFDKIGFDYFWSDNPFVKLDPYHLTIVVMFAFILISYYYHQHSSE